MAEAAPIPEYRCLICTTPYKDPRQLPCGHTFCCRCLTSYVEAEHVTADEDRHYFPCPVCDAPSAPRDVSTDVSTWAECFPINNLYLNPITAETSDVHLCAPCQRGKESNPAEVWCTDCGEKLCKQCRIYHERSKASSSHRLVSVSTIVGGICDVMVNEICPSHDGKQLDVYCVDHSVMCCGVCVSVSHRHCNNVKPIEDVVRKTKTGQHTRETELKELSEETKKMLDDDDLGMTLLTSTEKEVSAEMTNRIQQAKDKLDNLNVTYQLDLADKCKALRKKISARRMCVNTFNTNAENSHLLMSHLDQQISERHKFFIREQTKNQIPGHYRRMDQNTKKQPNRFDITLKLGTIIDEIMKMTTLGNVDVTSAITAVTQNANVCIGTMIETLLSTPSASTLADSTSTSDLTGSLQYLTVQPTPVKAAVDVWTGSVSCVKTVDSSTLGVSPTPSLAGGMFTDNNELLLTDSRNSRILLFDDTYSNVAELNIDGYPTDIVHGRADDEVFVAVNKDEILKCKLRNGQLTLINKISCSRGTVGIAFLGNNILVDTLESVKVMTVDGKVTKTIKKGGNHAFLATSLSSATVYHKDNHDVVCRRLDSDVEVYRYRDPRLNDPRGFGLDRDDNLYVCGHQSGNVHLVSPDGLRRRILVSNLSSISYPWCVVVHPTRQEFVVTSVSESTLLEVYRFKSK
ncbi:uncharacterized protein LOC110461790 [Mizuhopecten yessoensis]|uniref:E3 ubiquitin-protein ligase TRIM56 n=1 Tax=Mizuhopecten yessoensis TaxID=6573 RepID=A0A210PZL0_MIZYE|nr:uncharacterized protein LOC110461790 [Mizuhopecten yessoensis]OWF41920.1 E3 ubiquitin-protein ligase TRIM56 [Mizuhopecten yessoensis]